MEEVVQRILEKFSDFLEITNPISYMLRIIGWIIIKGLAWIVDSLENVTDSILLLKSFYNDTDVQGLVDMLLPLCGTLMGLSFLYTGYLIIFQKKVEREAIAVNMFLAFAVLALLGEGMDKANQFTDDAVSVLAEESDGTTAEQTIKKGITDLAQFDATGWKTTELEHPNRIPTSSILKINITQAIDKDFDPAGDRKISREGEMVFDNRLEYDDIGNSKLAKLDNGWLTPVKEKYYRYHVNWFTVMVTLAITAFTLLTIAIKLAKLFFELTFNYVLATIIAPADIHSGQKTKQVIQNILNTFLVTIMVFLSMKIYILGTDFIDAKLDGVAYLIALFAFSLAVIDGPNIVERLFGIDAGLKSSYGALAGAYAGVKGAQQGVQGLSSAGKSAALKGISGVAGVAGMAQGLRKEQEQGQEQKNGQGQNASQGGKGDANSKQQDKDLTDTQNTNGGNENENESSASEEVRAGMQEAASSLEQEMEQQTEEKNSMPGLHQEMASKGFSSNGKQSAAANSPHSISSGSPTQNDDLQKNEEMSGDYHSPSSQSPSFSQSNYPSVSSEMQEESNDVIPLQEKRTDRETRDLGQIISDKVQNNSSVKTVKRTYQIGENTGENIRRNIARYRRDRQN